MPADQIDAAGGESVETQQVEASDKKLTHLISSVVAAVHDRSEEMRASLQDTVLAHVKEFAAAKAGDVKRLAEIGIALSSERNLDKLLESIVIEARRFTSADAGTLYIKQKNEETGEDELRFEIMQTESTGFFAGGTTGNPIQAPSVPMVIDGEPNMANVSAYVAITGQRVNIPDVYDSEGHDFSKVRAFDENFGYKTTSMLVSPMRNHENEMIGVLQLINATDLDSSEVIDFSADFEELTHSLASQAAVAITNTQLTKGLQDLFESIIQMVATAIDQMSPYTGGHIQRVAGLSLALAQAINETKEGPLADEHLSPADITELYMAGWLHDVGKITTPVYVVDKARKLETIYDRIEAVKIRFGLIRRQIEIDALRSTMKVYADHEMDNNDKKMEIQRTRVEMQEALTEVDDELAFVVDLNTGGEFLDDEKLERLNTIAAKTYDNDGEPVPYLTEDEAANLGIRKGTLTGDERSIIENHVVMTKKMLDEVPFPNSLSNVVRYAADHHEKLDGSGYPLGKDDDALPLQSRILALADICEALTASDRPYKTPMSLEKAFQILGFMVKDNHVDSDLFDLFREKEIFKNFMVEENQRQETGEPPPAIFAQHGGSVEKEPETEAATAS